MILLVGERANGMRSSADWGWDVDKHVHHGAFRWGPARERLLEHGLRWDHAMNLLPAMPAQQATWTQEDREHARVMAWKVLKWRRGTIIVATGWRVAESFGVPADAEWKCVEHVVDDDMGVRLFTIPHPSGRNLWWNGVTNRLKAERLFRSLTCEGPCPGLEDIRGVDGLMEKLR